MRRIVPALILGGRHYGQLRTWRVSSNPFFADLDAAQAEVDAEWGEDERPRCTGVLFATGEDGCETVDHDGPCPVHDGPTDDDDETCKEESDG